MNRQIKKPDTQTLQPQLQEKKQQQIPTDKSNQQHLTKRTSNTARINSDDINVDGYHDFGKLTKLCPSFMKGIAKRLKKRKNSNLVVFNFFKMNTQDHRNGNLITVTRIIWMLWKMVLDSKWHKKVYQIISFHVVCEANVNTMYHKSVSDFFFYFLNYIFISKSNW